MDKIKNLVNLHKDKLNGDWGLGIGDWAQSPIPNRKNMIFKILFVNNLYLIN